MATTLTREQMETVIRRGGSVLHNGQTITRVQDLPSLAELAQGDPAAEAEALKALQQQMAEVQSQIAKLQPKAKAGA
jgi:hypothetical protein